MTPEKQAKIEELAVIATKKRETFMSLGMLNIANRLAGKREQIAKEYAVAEAEMLEADANLRTAQQP